MRVPLSWLGAFVDIDDLDLDELVDAMSLHGLEVEGVSRPGAGTAGVVTARVLEHAPHPDADTLQVVRVTHGEDEVELVCGAWNFETGDVVAHAEVGATLPGGMTLEARDIRGVTSNGMLCSARELELGEDHSGIMRLDPDLALGRDIREVLPLGEPVIDVAVFADRGDHHSVLGIAREVAAILDRPLSRDEHDEPGEPATDSVPVTIEDEEGCSQFVAWQVDGVRIGPSPWWLRQRLAQCGIRAINTVVDVTNYVMLELGQPLHAFDLDTLDGPEIVVRRARPGERLTTLDDVDRALETTDIVVADSDRPVGLAGVMGGADTEVGSSTTRVLLEGATWDPASVRSTSRRLDLVSEASMRFERGVDPGIARAAVARAAQLLEEIAGARAAGVTHAGSSAVERPAVLLDTTWTGAFLGVPDLDRSAQVGYLDRLGCDVTGADEDDVVAVTAPSWRADLLRPADLAEEVARLHGYETIPATLPASPVTGGRSDVQVGEREARAVCRAHGLHEAILRPFTDDEALVGVAPGDGRVRLANPLAKDADGLAPSLVEGLLGALRHNTGQGRPGVGLFEIARVFRPGGDPVEGTLRAFGDGWRWTDPDGEQLPTQPRVLGLAAQGLRHGPGWLDQDLTWDVYDLLAVADDVVGRLAPAGADWRLERDQDVRRPWLHPGRTAGLRLDGHEVGIIGQVHPDEAERRDLPEPAIVGELLLEPLLEHLSEGRRPVRAHELTRHPAVTVDVAVVARDEVPYARIEQAVRAGAGDLLDALWQFDVYRGEQLGEGHRSVALRLRLQSADRQLTDEDAEAVIDSVEDEVQELGAGLRR